jgi:hypothetical protein
MSYKIEPTDHMHIGATSGVVNELCDVMSVDAMQKEFQKVLDRHFSGDWGNVDAHDRKVNDNALKYGTRVLSAYNISGVDVWVITDAADANGVRHTTTILRPSDY